jgi:hypothetical protein
VVSRLNCRDIHDTKRSAEIDKEPSGLELVVSNEHAQSLWYRKLALTRHSACPLEGSVHDGPDALISGRAQVASLLLFRSAL